MRFNVMDKSEYYCSQGYVKVKEKYLCVLRHEDLFMLGDIHRI